MNEPINFQPQGSPRPGAVYVSRKLLKAMRYAAKRQKCTVEDLFEKEMMQLLLEKHRDIVDRVDRLEQEEKDWIKSLEKPKP